ncbi:MAG: flap endonuclease-1 [Candidatus Micrarchaeota archaeon]|nr:flap endonuclease-1 [Candidatus Micrarchaeota archaeon]
MGVDLGDLAVKRPITLQSLSGKVVAIDAFNTLYQFLASIRQEDGQPLMDFKGRITAHLSGLFYRTARLVENGIKPVYVFDGKPPAFKKRTTQERAQNKKEAEEKWKKALEEERYDDAKKYAQATSRLTQEMVEESKLLLKAIGIPHIQAPSEGEAQACWMVKNDLADIAASQDYDALLFGAPMLVRNLSITGRRKIPRQDKYILIEPEQINLQETLKTLEVSQEQLIIMGILTGTDFNEGVKGVGPKTALKILKEHKTLDKVMLYVADKYKYTFEADPQDVLDFFLNPPYVELKEKLVWGKISKEDVDRILVRDHDFSEERIVGTIERMHKSFDEKGNQSKLDKWF